MNRCDNCKKNEVDKKVRLVSLLLTTISLGLVFSSLYFESVYGLLISFSSSIVFLALTIIYSEDQDDN